MLLQTISHHVNDMMHASRFDIFLGNEHHCHMRTTLTLDDDLVPLVKRYANDRSIALGKAVSDLVRRALTTPRPTRDAGGVIVFDLSPQSPRVTTKRVRELESEQ